MNAWDDVIFFGIRGKSLQCGVPNFPGIIETLAYNISIVNANPVRTDQSE